MFLSPTHPLTVRVHVRLDGKTLERAWDEFIDYLYKYTDADGDGTVTAKEAESAPRPELLDINGLFGGRFGGPGGRGGALKGSGPKGAVTRADLAEYYRAAGTQSFHLNAGGDNPKLRGGFPFGQASAPPDFKQVNTALMKALDTNRDGKLSRKELAAARQVLLRLDADEDEIVTVKEVLGDYSTLDPGIFGGVAFGGDGPPKVQEAPRVFLTSGATPREVARRMLERYRGKDTGKKALTRKDLPLDAAAFARLDQDDNGELDQEELARFAERGPDLEVVVNIGALKPGQAVVEVIRPKGWAAPAGLRAVRTADSVRLEFGHSRLDVRVGEVQTREQLGYFIRQIFQQQFNQADRDNNGYVDEKEAGRFGFGDAFKMMDRDGDAKVYEKELTGFLDTVEDLQARSKASCASLKYSDSGTGFFELFDTNRDGKLSLRELLRLPALVDDLDGDGDGCVAPAEIPHLYQFKLDQGPGSTGINQFAFFAGMGGEAQARPRTGRGPEWFQRMDRNRDGDLSRAEFLGGDELFRRIDADGDGLISAEEAQRYDATLKNGRK
jgi:Ca2+-binding EF-hand superfamily protein